VLQDQDQGGRPTKRCHTRQLPNCSSAECWGISWLLRLIHVMSAVSLNGTNSALRHVRWALYVAGFVFNEVLARGLKHLLRHGRPAELCSLLGTCDSHGMPSSHTQCMAFALGLRLCWTAAFWGSKTAVPSARSSILGWFEVAALTGLTVAVGTSRVYLGYHHEEQVIAGAIIGLLFACSWALFMSWIRPLRRRLLRSAFGFALQLSDDTVGHSQSHSSVSKDM
jgi:membrane-associated phospholipid phosphatase